MAVAVTWDWGKNDMEQFSEHSDWDWGALTFQKGPGNIHCWTGRIADTEILFSVILNTSELRSANLDFIRSGASKLAGVSFKSGA